MINEEEMELFQRILKGLKSVTILLFLVGVLLITLLGLFIWHARIAHAGPYAEIFAGPSFWRDCSNDEEIEAACQMEIMGGIAGGYQFQYVALEGEISYRGATTHNVKNEDNIGRSDEQGHVITGLGNVWLSYPLGNWRPYIGGGIGLGSARLAGERDLSWVAQTGLGVDLALTEAWSVGVGCRYLYMGKTQHRRRETNFNAYSCIMGARYTF